MITEARYALRDGSTAVARHAPGADATRPELVLVHGAGGSHHAFDALIAHLSPPHAVFVPALPGRCGSQGPAREDAGEVARWLAALLDAASIASRSGASPPPVLFGHSYGGAVAIEYALARPVSALILAATGARLRVHPSILSQAREAAARGAHAPLDPRAYGPGAPDALREQVERASRLAPPEATLADWVATDRFDRMAALAQITAPVLVIGGELDPLTPPKYHRYLAEHIAGAELLIVPGASHMLTDTHAEVVAGAIREFVARRAGA